MMKFIPYSELMWNIVVEYVIEYKSFNSITGIQYSAILKDGNIYYKGGDRNNMEEEIITKIEFIECVKAVEKLSVVNTNIIKTVIPNSMYRKRTPFIGLLFSAGLLVT